VSTGRKWLAAGTLLVVAAAIGVAAYFMRDGSAKERSARRPPPGVPVSVAEAVQRDVPFKIGAIGNVEPYSTVAVKARVDGQILAVGFREGQQVSKGQVLFRIDPRPFEAALKQAEANALRDAAARDQAASQAKRYKELLDKNFVSSESYAQFATNAQTADAVAQASRAALENARLNLAYCTIVSPIEGYAGRVLLQAGNLVKANDANPLVIINQVRPIFVTFSVPEQQLPEIRKYRAEGHLCSWTTQSIRQPGPSSCGRSSKTAIWRCGRASSCRSASGCSRKPARSSCPPPPSRPALTGSTST